MTHDPAHRPVPHPVFPLSEVAHGDGGEGIDYRNHILRQLREQLRRDEEEAQREADRLHLAQQEEHERRLTTMGDD